MSLNSIHLFSKTNRLDIRIIIPSLLLCCSALAFSHSIWIYAKAELAQILIAQSWQKTIAQTVNSEATANQFRPWPWADTWPVARLKVPKYNIDLYVLAGSQGNSLAFGPGHIDGTSNPENPSSGTIVYSGHRDTHFNFLKQLMLNDPISVQDANGIWHYYRVTQTEVKNIEKDLWFIDNNIKQLKLVTCYPFDAINPGGPLRFIITAIPIIPTTSQLALSDDLSF